MLALFAHQVALSDGHSVRLMDWEVMGHGWPPSGIQLKCVPHHMVWSGCALGCGSWSASCLKLPAQRGPANWSSVTATEGADRAGTHGCTTPEWPAKVPIPVHPCSRASQPALQQRATVHSALWQHNSHSSSRSNTLNSPCVVVIRHGRGCRV